MYTKKIIALKYVLTRYIGKDGLKKEEVEYFEEDFDGIKEIPWYEWIVKCHDGEFGLVTEKREYVTESCEVYSQEWRKRR